MSVDTQQKESYGLFINGETVEAHSGETLDTYNPATGQVIAQVAAAGKEDIDRAVKAARQAFDSGVWSEKSAAERSIILNRVADLLQQSAGELAALETRNNGKPINESTYVDLPMTIDCFRFYAAAARMIKGETMPGGGMLNYTLKEPIGVVGQIIPWNFPLMMAAWKLGPALAAGNSVVLKPAEQTPLTALKLAQLFKEAGLPDGVVNVVPGYGETAGEALVLHPQVDKIAFTGSTETGKRIMANASQSLKRLSLELGGKSPNVVFDDADLEQAVNGALFAIYFNQGQCCTAGSRLFLQAGIYDAFMEKFLGKIARLQVGDPSQNTTQIGPLVSREQYDRVRNYIEVGQGEGAQVAFGGSGKLDFADGDLDAGYFVRPTIFTGVRNEMRIAQEEIFGPVVSVLRFSDEAEAVRLVNDVAYGLAAAVWSQDIKRAHTFARHVKAGYVWINTYNVLPVEAPFGGFKQSGFGRELGQAALDMYTETKNVCVELNPVSPVTGWFRV